MRGLEKSGGWGPSGRSGVSVTTAHEECVGGGNNEGQQEDLGRCQRKEEGRDRRLQAKTW